MYLTSHPDGLCWFLSSIIFLQSVLTQIGSILDDQPRLVRRSQLKRVDFRVLGKPQSTAAPTPSPSVATSDPQPSVQLPQDEFDQEVFDDHDFYQTLLKDLISSGIGSSLSCLHLLALNSPTL